MTNLLTARKHSGRRGDVVKKPQTFIEGCKWVLCTTNIFPNPRVLFWSSEQQETKLIIGSHELVTGVNVQYIPFLAHRFKIKLVTIVNVPIWNRFFYLTPRANMEAIDWFSNRFPPIWQKGFEFFQTKNPYWEFHVMEYKF